MMPDMDALTRDAVRTVRALVSTPPDERERRTALMKELAELQFQLRQLHLDKEGHPDYAGRTWALREKVRSIYAEAGLKPYDAKILQATVRYHIAAVLRERLPADELERLGLRQDTPRERRSESLIRVRALAQAHLEREGGMSEPRMITASLALLRKVDPDRLRELPEDAQRSTDDALRAIAERAKELRRR